ncbi:MAG: hypothetical protein AAFY71_10735 [Bacteroidota bacterium]
MILNVSLLLSSGFLGIFLGAQLMEALLFVPAWKALKADDFFDFYHKYGKKIHRFFSPLTVITKAISLWTVGYSFTQANMYSLLFGLMGFATLAFFSTYFLYFKQANKRFFERGFTDEQLPSELRKWGYWHWTRIFFELVALCLSLFLLMEQAGYISS